MTTQEMIDSFLLLYDLNGSGAVAGFTNDEIIDFLNKSQLDIVKKGFLKSGPALFPNLVDSYMLLMVATQASDALFMINSAKSTLTLPVDYLFYIDSSTLVQRTNFPTITTEEWIQNKRIHLSDLYKFTVGVANKAIFYNPVVVLHEGTIIIAYDAYTTINDLGGETGNATMIYLKSPVDMTISVNSELLERWHQDIVDNALLTALMTVNDTRIRQAQNKE